MTSQVTSVPTGIDIVAAGSAGAPLICSNVAASLKVPRAPWRVDVEPG